MIDDPDITATIIFHREGPYVLPALDSLADQIEAARRYGMTVEARAVLDSADASTRHLVMTRGAWLDGVEEVSFGDLGLSRNAAVHKARGAFLAFFDGDDLWGAEWLRRAYDAATASAAAREAIWHPEVLFYFTEDDFDRHPWGRIPHPAARSHYLIQRSSEAVEIDRSALLLDNIWSANAFAARSIYQSHPYSAVDRNRGFGIEDWSWNMDTLSAGIPHHVVSGTVHLIRMKAESLNQKNMSEGLLPFLPDRARLAEALGLDAGAAPLPSQSSASSAASTERTDRTLG